MILDNVLGYQPSKYLEWHGGVYAIRNLITDRAYIGATHSFLKRYGQHKTQLRNNRHKNVEMQADWNALGPEYFKFDVVISFRYTYFRRDCINRQEISELELACYREHEHNCYNAWRAL